LLHLDSSESNPNTTTRLKCILWVAEGGEK
jgi:hypothetical protein